MYIKCLRNVNAKSSQNIGKPVTFRKRSQGMTDTKKTFPFPATITK